MKKKCTDAVGWKVAQEKTKKTWEQKVEQAKINYYKSPRLCSECNEIIPYGKDRRVKFCSHSCAATFNNKGVRRHGVSKTNSTCLHCKKIFSYSPKVKSGKFCSKFCKTEYVFLNDILVKFKNNLLNHQRSIKKCVIHLNGNVCVQCGNNGIHNNSPLVLQLDHIDGDSDNNLPSNLRLLCPNCHSQTSTYKSRNKNSSRAKYRRNYYNRISGQQESGND